MPRSAVPLDPERETRLTAAAATAFTEVGYELASLNHIISEAGLAKSSFYHYFPDKQRLHDHVVLTLRTRLGRGLRLPDIEDLDAGTYWQAVATLLFDLEATMAKDPQTRLLVGMFHHRLAARGPTGQLTRLRAEVAAWTARAVEAGVRLGVLRRDIPVSLLADVALGILRALTDPEPYEKADLPWSEVANRLLRDALTQAREP